MESARNHLKTMREGGWRLTLAEIAQIEEEIYSPEFLRMAILLGEDNCRRVYLEHYERMREASGAAEAAMAARKGAEASLLALARAKANPIQAGWLASKAEKAERARGGESAEREAAGLPFRFERRLREWVFPDHWAPVPYVDFA